MPRKPSAKRKQWKKAFSAGGLVIRKESGSEPELLLIRPAGGNKERGLKEVWTFPKGSIGDHGEESTEEAALREVKEEGGVKAEIVRDLGEIQYFFYFEGQGYHKTVHYYLMRYLSGDPKNHDREVEEAIWAPLSKVRAKLTYKTDLEILEQVLPSLGFDNSGRVL